MKGLVGLLIAGTVSRIGSVLTFLAIPWLVLETTGSPSRMGLAAAAELLPYVLIGPSARPWSTGSGRAACPSSPTWPAPR
ncbi:hypothetical protein ACFQZ4_10800 [Catellatospora coxensis]